MEENKAPEKLYIDSREHWRKSWTAFTTKAKGDDIEYVRKDVLIEKACVKLKKLMYDNLMFQGRLQKKEHKLHKLNEL